METLTDQRALEVCKSGLQLLLVEKSGKVACNIDWSRPSGSVRILWTLVVKVVNQVIVNSLVNTSEQEDCGRQKAHIIIIKLLVLGIM